MKISQYSTINALMNGMYDGFKSLKSIVKSNSIGVGTIDKLNGELVVLDGIPYQVDAYCSIHQLDLKTKVPFATMASFEPEKEIILKKMLGVESLDHQMKLYAPQRNNFIAFKIHGTFSKVSVRSVPEQKKPYKKLPDITKFQIESDIQNTTGTIIGFRFPTYMKMLVPAGLHMHYIDDELQRGGHVRDFALTEATLQLSTFSEFELIVPKKNPDFDKCDLSKDCSKVVKIVES